MHAFCMVSCNQKNSIMEKPKPMLTLSQVMTKLAQKGITNEFIMNEQGQMHLRDQEATYQPQDLTILRSYRFEGDSNPDDNAVLYVAEDKNGSKGMIIDSYGADSNYDGESFDNFIREIPVEEDESLNFDT